MEQGAGALEYTLSKFDEWSDNYENALKWKFFFVPLHKSLLREMGDVRGASIIDIGCGTGDMLRRLATMGAGRLVGIDACPGMLKVARSVVMDKHYIDYQFGSAEDIPFNNCEFDFVITSLAFHHFPFPEASVNEAARVLKNNGKLIVCDWCGDSVISRPMLAYGKIFRTDSRYMERTKMMELAFDAGFAKATTKMLFRVPAVMLVKASNPYN